MHPLRSTLLWASGNPHLERVVRSSRAMRPLVRRFMPGEDAAAALGAARALREVGTPTILTYLGENVRDARAAEGSVDEYARLLDTLAGERLDTHLSVKLTQLGWDLSIPAAVDRLRRLAERAAALGNIVMIDMEGSAYVDSTVDAFAELAPRHPNLGLCLQAYLYRTPRDLERLLPLHPRIRLVKGAYREPASIAHARKSDVDAHYLELGRALLDATRHGAGPAFGTHDLPLVARLHDAARALGVPESAFEVQMLYGIQDAGRRRLAAEGLRTRVLISYGHAWYPWFMRRLAERPANLGFLLRNLPS